MPLSDLDVALGRGTRVSESDAFAAYRALESNDPTMDQFHPAPGVSLRQKYQQDLDSYLTDTDAGGLPVFPTESARLTREQDTHNRKLFAGVDKLKDAVTPDQFAELQERSKLALDPEDYLAGAALKSLWKPGGQMVNPDQWDTYRNAIAKQEFGLEGDTSNKAVYAAVQKRFADGESAHSSTQTSAETIARTIYAGDPSQKTLNAELAKISSYPAHLREPARQQLQQAFAVARDTASATKPIAARLEKFVLQQSGRIEHDIQSQGDDNFASAIEAFTALKPHEQAAVAIQLEQRLKSLPAPDQDLATRTASSGARAFSSIAGSLKMFADRLAISAKDTAVTASGGDASKSNLREKDQLDATLRAYTFFKNLTDGEAFAGKLLQQNEGWGSEMMLGAASQAPIMAFALTGAGGVSVLGASMAGDSYTQARTAQPDADPNKQFGAAIISGGVQSALEFYATKATFGLMTKRLPALNTFMSKLGITNAAARAGIAGTTALAGTVGSEYFEEVAQGASDKLLQDFATQASGLNPAIPGNSWEDFIKAWAPNTPQGRQTLMAIMPYALVVMGAASFNNFRWGKALQQNRPVMEALQIAPEKIDSIANAATPEEGSAIMREAFTEAMQNVNLEKQRQDVATFSAVFKEAGENPWSSPFRQVYSEQEDLTRFEVHLPGESAVQFDSVEDAWGHWQQWKQNIAADELDAVRDAFHFAGKDLLDFLTSENQHAETGVRIEDQTATRMTPTEAVRRGFVSQQAFNERIKAFALQEGVDFSEAARKFAQSGQGTIRAMTFPETLRDGTMRHVVRIFEGADPINIAEDIAETFWKGGLATGTLNPKQIVADLRTLERTTGQRYLADSITSENAWHEESQLHLVEALSAASREYLVANRGNASLPETFSRWLDMLIAYAAHVFEHAKLLARSEAFDKATKSGAISKRFLDQVADSVGLSESAQRQRFEARERAQIAADIAGEFEEVADFAKGKLPHPSTLEQNQHPLAGEIRRLWEGLTKETSRRRKDGSLVRSAQAADNYFLPKGKMASIDDIRQTANERGFDFDTPADFIEAIDSSINYNKPIYATQGSEHNLAGASFAISPSSVDEAFQPFDGTPLKRAEKFLRSISNKPLTTSDGLTATVSNKTAEKMISTSAVAKSSSLDAHLAAIANIEGLFAHASIEDTHPDRDSDPNITAIHRVHAPFSFEGKNYEAKFTVKALAQAIQGNRIYSIEAIETQDAPERKWTDASPVSGLTSAPQSEAQEESTRTAITPQAETRSFPTTDGGTLTGPASFAIAAFHGTPHQVDRFKTDNIGTGEGHQVYGWGLYFAQEYEVADHYRRLTSKPGEGNLYNVTLNAEHDELLDWDTPLHEQPLILDALKSADWWQYAEAHFDRRMDNPVGHDVIRYLSEDMEPQEASEALAALGIKGIRYLDGQNRSADTRRTDATRNFVIFSDKDITITHENGEPITADSGITFALSQNQLNDLDRYLTKRMNEGPAERAEAYTKLRDRLAGAVLRQEEIANGTHPLVRRKGALDPIAEERRRIKELIGSVNAITSAFPAEVRGKVNANINAVLDADGPRAVVTALRSLVEKLDEALEPHLQDSYIEALQKLIDRGQADREAGKPAYGRMTPDSQQLFDMAINYMAMDANEVGLETTAQEAKLTELDPDKFDNAAAYQKAQQEISMRIIYLGLFGNIANRSAAEMEKAFDNLTAIYTNGRAVRIVLDEAQQAQRRAWRDDTMADLGPQSDARHTAATTLTGWADVKDLLGGLEMGMRSFHQVMEFIFPTSAAARQFQARERLAQTFSTRMRLNAQQRFEDALTGMGFTTRRQRQKFLSSLNQSVDTGIMIQEGAKTKKEKLTVDQARRVLKGEIKTGWENDRISMMSLANAVREFDLLPAKKRARIENIYFSRTISRGEPGVLQRSDGELLNLYMLSLQPEYLPALDRYGFTEAVLKQIEAKLFKGSIKSVQDAAAANVEKPSFADLTAAQSSRGEKMRQLHAFLANEYAEGYHRINPVFRSLFGMDMPQIRNYSPGIFENMNSGAAGDVLDPFGSSLASPNALSAGFTRNRKAHMARPKNVSALDAWRAHSETTAHFIAYAELMRDMAAVFKVPEVRRGIETAHGKRVADTFSKWLDMLNTEGRQAATMQIAFAQVSASMLTSQSALALSWNFGTVLKQGSAAFGFAMDMAPGKAISGFLRALANPADLKKLWAMESIQQRLNDGFSPEDKALMAKANAKPSLILDLLAAGRLPIALTDAALTTFSGSVAYQQAKADALAAGLSEARAEEAALAAFDRTIFRTAQPSRLAEKSLMELEIGGNSFAKPFILFKSDPRQKFALFTEAARQFIGDPNAKNAVNLGARFVTTWIMYGILAQLGTDLWKSIARDHDDEDFEAWQAKDYLAAALSGPITAIPLAGTAFDFLLKRIITGKAYTNNPSPLDQAAAKLYTSAEKIASGNEVNFKDAIGVANALSQLAATIDPRIAALGVAVTRSRDAYGIGENLGDIIFGKSEAEQQRATVRDLRKAQKLEDEQAKKDKDARKKAFLSLTPEQQEAALDNAGDRESFREMLNQRKASTLSPEEKALGRLSPAYRAQAIRAFEAEKPEEQRANFREKLRFAGVLNRETEAQLQKLDNE